MYPVLPWKHNSAFNVHFWTARVAVNEWNTRCHYKAANMVTVLWHLPYFYSSNALVSRYTLFLPHFQNIHACHKWFSSLKMVLNLTLYIYIYIYIYIYKDSVRSELSLYTYVPPVCSFPYPIFCCSHLHSFVPLSWLHWHH